MDAERIQRHPANQGVLRYLNGDAPHAPLMALPESVPDPYFGQGSHPDIVERIWDELGKAVPAYRCLLYGVPVLVHPGTGVVMAIAGGTRYALRLLEEAWEEAQQAGARTVARGSDGGELNLRETLGEDWIFGGWLKQEITWCRNLFDALERQCTQT
jgi:hypothetical protein